MPEFCRARPWLLRGFVLIVWILALNVRGAGLQDNMGQWTLRELVHEAVQQPRRQADRWIKMIKQAGSQGKGGG